MLHFEIFNKIKSAVCNDDVKLVPRVLCTSEYFKQESYFDTTCRHIKKHFSNKSVVNETKFGVGFGACSGINRIFKTSFQMSRQYRREYRDRGRLEWVKTGTSPTVTAPRESPFLLNYRWHSFIFPWHLVLACVATASMCQT